MVPLRAGLLAAAACSLAPLVCAAEESAAGVFPSEFERYQAERVLELKQEQAARGAPVTPPSAQEERRESRRLSAERFQQRLLLDRQRRGVASERAKPPLPAGPASTRGQIRQRLRTEQAGERLRRERAR